MCPSHCSQGRTFLSHFFQFSTRKLSQRRKKLPKSSDPCCCMDLCGSGYFYASAFTCLWNTNWVSESYSKWQQEGAVSFKSLLRTSDAGVLHSPLFVFFQWTSGKQKVSENKLCGLMLGAAESRMLMCFMCYLMRLNIYPTFVISITSSKEKKELQFENCPWLCLSSEIWKFRFLKWESFLHLCSLLASGTTSEGKYSAESVEF